MGEEAEARIAHLQSVPYREIERRIMEKTTICIHEIFAEWCSICKYEGTTSVKQLLREKNIETVENFLKWPLSTKK